MRVALTFVLLYLTLDRLALALGSMRGERGLAVCVVVLTLAVLTEHWLAPRRLGDRRKIRMPRALRRETASQVRGFGVLSCRKQADPRGRTPELV